MENINDYMLVSISHNNQMIFFGDTNEYRFHLDCLKDYFYIYYSKLAEEIDVDNIKCIEKIILYLIDEGNIIYLHSLGYGLVFVPEIISNEQLNLLHKLCLLLDNIPLYFVYNLHCDNGEIVFEQFHDDGENFNAVKQFDTFLLKKNLVKVDRSSSYEK